MALTKTPRTPADFWRAYDLVGDAASGKIGNTRQVALSTYVQPEIFSEWREASGVPEGTERPKRGNAASKNVGGAAGEHAGVLRDAIVSPREEGLKQGGAESLATFSPDKLLITMAASPTGPA